MSGARLALAVLVLFPGPSRAQIRPQNFDTPTYIEVEFQEVRVAEGAVRATINLIRSGEFRIYTRVSFETVDGTARAGDDYKASGGTLVFKPGEGYRSVEIELLGGEGGGKSFEVRLSSSSPNTMVMTEAVSVVIPPAAAPDPVLHISPAADGAVKLFWAEGADLVLERSRRPESPAWESVPCEVEIRDGVCAVVEQCEPGFYFYRLRAP